MYQGCETVGAVPDLNPTVRKNRIRIQSSKKNSDLDHRDPAVSGFLTLVVIILRFACLRSWTSRASDEIGKQHVENISSDQGFT